MKIQIFHHASINDIMSTTYAMTVKLQLSVQLNLSLSRIQLMIHVECAQ